MDKKLEGLPFIPEEDVVVGIGIVLKEVAVVADCDLDVHEF